MKIRLQFLVKLITATLLVVAAYKSYGQVADPCAELQRPRKRTEHAWPLIIANETIIRPKELDEKLIDTVWVLKCPEAYPKFKNLATAGVIAIKTRQSFETLPLNEIVEAVKPRKVLLFINGIMTEDLSLKISKKAIVKMDIFLNKITTDKHMNRDIAQVTIWTITRKERRRSVKLPKLCRGVGSSSAGM